jgi:hypothetical protein
MALTNSILDSPTGYGVCVSSRVQHICPHVKGAEAPNELGPTRSAIFNL